MTRAWMLSETSQVQELLSTLLKACERRNPLKDIPHRFRKKFSVWFNISVKRQNRWVRQWKKGLREIVASAKRRPNIILTVEGLQNLTPSELEQLNEYLMGKSLSPSLARLVVHQTTRGLGSSSLDSKHFMLCCICIGPEATASAISKAKRFKLKPLRRVSGSVFSGKRR